MLLFLAGGVALWFLAAAFILSVCRSAANADDSSRGRRFARVSRRGASASLAVAAVTLPIAPDEAAAAACANRDLEFLANSHVVRDAMLCEIARVRERRSARALRASGELDLAAGRHAADMFERRYFSHVSPGGGDLGDRARRAGFAKRSCWWTVGEVLSWGMGSRSTAAGTVRAWMASPSHRRILISRRYGQVGLGLQAGTPFDAYPSGVTVAAVLGRRHCS
jgi:uncharacterized protein YkwD